MEITKHLIGHHIESLYISKTFEVLEIGRSDKMVCFHVILSPGQSASFGSINRLFGSIAADGHTVNAAMSCTTIGANNKNETCLVLVIYVYIRL